MKVKNIGSNMTEVTTPEGITVLVSYETPVACHVPIEGYFRTATKWSRTTTGHINKWLGGVQAAEKPQEFFDNL